MIRSAVLRYRYLFSQLVRRELRQKYKGSALGILWYFVNPLVIMAMYGLLLGPLLKAVNYPEYPIFILAGLLVWLFWSQSLLSGSTSLVDQTSLVSKVRFPRETVPSAAVTVQLVPFFAMLVMLLPVAMILRGDASLSMLLLVPLTLCLFLMTLGMCFALAVLHAYYRDVQPILNAVLLPLFFASGVLFQITQLPGLHSHAWAGPLLRWGNPIAPFIDAIRTVIYDGRTPSGAELIYVVGAAAISMVVGVIIFRRMEGELAVVL
ncbi:MAG: ABC transporter permease [Solirubrobacteraceae bacterium]